MINGGRQPSCDGTSRMNREVHVRFCEGLGVKFPGPTRHGLPAVYVPRTAASPQLADITWESRGDRVGPILL
jgi:hypothetical protein